ncbi:MAG: TIGR04283 family arsenosugar biosynthesis glycosyltransferase [Candidatus Omnitrophota bacterium]
MISVIIPIYNEEKILSISAQYFKELSQKAELLFVDGGSQDGSAKIAGSYAKVIRADRGRGSQMNSGARASSHSALLFLHADTSIPEDVLSSVEEALKRRGIAGGCLTQRIDKEGLIYRIIEGFGNLRARVTKVFYGDQGIFVDKEIFFELDGFPAVPVLEDALFSKKLRSKGRTEVLRKKITVSPRRWEKRGILKTAMLYTSLNILFWLRVPLQKIKDLYEDLR